MLLIPTLLCPKSWEGMSGNETQRFCSYCKKHVHNLEALSVSDRLALLSSPAGSICSRYQVAIRRPAKGKEESYNLHLAKHGAGVVLVGSVLVVLWEMHGQAEKERYYRAVAPTSSADLTTHCGMPEEYFCQHRAVVLGGIDSDPPFRSTLKPVSSTSNIPLIVHVDLKLDPLEIDRIFNASTPEALRFPTADVENKKGRRNRRPLKQH